VEPPHKELRNSFMNSLSLENSRDPLSLKVSQLFKIKVVEYLSCQKPLSCQSIKNNIFIRVFKKLGVP
jgi:hypothetical protein